jgi:hypothetical protein
MVHESARRVLHDAWCMREPHLQECLLRRASLPRGFERRGHLLRHLSSARAAGEVRAYSAKQPVLEVAKNGLLYAARHMCRQSFPYDLAQLACSCNLSTAHTVCTVYVESGGCSRRAYLIGPPHVHVAHVLRHVFGEELQAGVLGRHH